MKRRGDKARRVAPTQLKVGEGRRPWSKTYFLSFFKGRVL